MLEESQSFLLISWSVFSITNSYDTPSQRNAFSRLESSTGGIASHRNVCIAIDHYYLHAGPQRYVQRYHSI